MSGPNETQLQGLLAILRELGDALNASDRETWKVFVGAILPDKVADWNRRLLDTIERNTG